MSPPPGTCNMENHLFINACHYQILTVLTDLSMFVKCLHIDTLKQVTT